MFQDIHPRALAPIDVTPDLVDGFLDRLVKERGDGPVPGIAVPRDGD